MRKFLALLIMMPLAGCIDYSDGDRVGTIVKFSKKGLLCKTWEGELLVGGLKRVTQSSTDGNGNVRSSSSMALNVMEFTVEKQDLIQPILDAMETGKQVKMHYQQELVTICRSDGTDSFVQTVKVLD